MGACRSRWIRCRAGPVVKAIWQADLDAVSSLTQASVAGALGPALTEARESARKAQCLANVKNLSLAMNMYVADYNAYPKADQWVTQLKDYVKNDSTFKCPDDGSDAKCSYGMNWSLSGKPANLVKDTGKRIVYLRNRPPRRLSARRQERPRLSPAPPGWKQLRLRRRPCQVDSRRRREGQGHRDLVGHQGIGSHLSPFNSHLSRRRRAKGAPRPCSACHRDWWLDQEGLP